MTVSTKLQSFKERVPCTYIFLLHRIFQETNLPICDSMIYEILPSLEFNCYFLELKLILRHRKRKQTYVMDGYLPGRGIRDYEMFMVY